MSTICRTKPFYYPLKSEQGSVRRSSALIYLCALTVRREDQYECRTLYSMLQIFNSVDKPFYRHFGRNEFPAPTLYYVAEAFFLLHMECLALPYRKGGGDPGISSAQVHSPVFFLCNLRMPRIDQLIKILSTTYSSMCYVLFPLCPRHHHQTATLEYQQPIRYRTCFPVQSSSIL